ncbi:MAG: GatB/YqeY domain-containing protein [Chloroflexota bacterium]|nr:GatB/YqeY domain-containing protein [Chloroflexota bacterium]
MSLKARLMSDLKVAMREGTQARKDAIRMVRAAIKNKEIELQQEIADEEIIEIISQEIKRRREAIEMFEKGRRGDLVDREKAQLDVLLSYMPKQLSREEIEKIVQDIVDDMNATSIRQLGPVMGKAMAEIKGRADGSEVNEVAREILSR